MPPLSSVCAPTKWVMEQNPHEVDQGRASANLSTANDPRAAVGGLLRQPRDGDLVAGQRDSRTGRDVDVARRDDVRLEDVTLAVGDRERDLSPLPVRIFVRYRHTIAIHCDGGRYEMVTVDDGHR